MKRALVIIFVVALLGVIGLYNSKHSTTANSAASNTGSGPSTQIQGQRSTSNSQSSSVSPAANASYKDGTYTGDAAETPYGTVQIAVIISGSKITDVNFLQMPSDQGHSREVTAFSEPLLKQTTLQNQSANIDFVSGATSTSYGYQESLQAALDKAAGTSMVTPAQFNV